MTKAVLIYNEGERKELEPSEIAETLRNLMERGELIRPKLYY